MQILRTATFAYAIFAHLAPAPRSPRHISPRKRLKKGQIRGEFRIRPSVSQELLMERYRLCIIFSGGQKKCHLMGLLLTFDDVVVQLEESFS